MCVACKVNLIDAGTAGYLGQSMFIQPMFTECYDCTPHLPQRSFPTCTIRRQPTLPMHCLVWAQQYLFPHLIEQLCKEKDGSSLSLSLSPSVPEKNHLSLSAGSKKSLKKLALHLLHQLFHEEIVKLTEWAKDTFEKLPLPLTFPSLHLEKEEKETETSSMFLDFDQSQSILSPLELANLFVTSLTELLHDHFKSTTAPSPTTANASETTLAPSPSPSSLEQGLLYDKDNPLHVHFIYAASNLRSVCFHVPALSLYAFQSLANHIIPSIATTNAMVAAFMVLPLSSGSLSVEPQPPRPYRDDSVSDTDTVSHVLHDHPPRELNGERGGGGCWYLEKKSDRVMYPTHLYGSRNFNCPTCSHSFFLAQGSLGSKFSDFLTGFLHMLKKRMEAHMSKKKQDEHQGILKKHNPKVDPHPNPHEAVFFSRLDGIQEKDLEDIEITVYHGFRLLYDMEETSNVTKSLTDLNVPSKSWVFIEIDPPSSSSTPTPTPTPPFISSCYVYVEHVSSEKNWLFTSLHSSNHLDPPQFDRKRKQRSFDSSSEL
ncbi:E1 ubiquitin-activating protein uba2 [Coelomomyces lativittatus]|nr:E1 ubiquitin-activating protein uba2 [Coelomomyces lativittatus]